MHVHGIALALLATYAISQVTAFEVHCCSARCLVPPSPVCSCNSIQHWL